MKNIILIACSIFIISGIQAQTTFKIGVNRADLDLDNKDFYKVSSKSNYLIGLHHLFVFNKNIGLEAGLMYQRFSNDFKGGPDIYDFDRDYLAVPINIKFNPVSRFSFGAGIQTSFKVKDSFSENFDNRDFDISAQLMASVRIFRSIGLEFGYNLGFLPLVEFDMKSVGDVNFTNGEAKNRYFYGAAYYKF